MRFAVFPDADCAAREAIKLIAEEAATAVAVRAQGVSNLRS